MTRRLAKACVAGGPRTRMSRDERCAQIVAGAIAFFAEHGLAGQTRDLAAQLGVTHALLYRYFPSKQALLERVYRDVFLSRWNPQWNVELSDPTRSFAERVQHFYRDYARMILTKEAVRIFVYSGLDRSTIPQRFLKRIQRRIFVPLLSSLRAELGLPPISQCAITEAERELLWQLHGGIFYIGIRHWIYGLPLPHDLDQAIALRTNAFLASAPALIQRAVLAVALPG